MQSVMSNSFKTIIKASLTLWYVSQIGLRVKHLTEKFRAPTAQGHLVQLMHKFPLLAILSFTIQPLLEYL